jgi:HSP20 family protein
MRPFPNDLLALRDQMNRLFEEQSPSNAHLWAPAVDVSENDSEIVLHAELPGMNKDDIDIQLTGDTLTLRGERKMQSAQRGEHFHRIERQYGAWQRTFQIETPLDANGVSATYEEGVLTVRLPKQQAVQPRQIAIEVN